MSTASPIIRVLTANDDAGIASVIRLVSAEYGLTPDKGFSVADKTLDILSQVYNRDNACYLVIELDGKIMGVVDADQGDVDEIGLMMTGSTSKG